MRGKPRGQYGPTGERHSGIRYVPPKEQKEMAEQWRTIYERQQARIVALEAERDALAAWECESCGARFAEYVRPSELVGVTYCASCAEREALRSHLHTRNGELMVERMNLDMLRDDVKRAIALLPHDPGAAMGVLVSALRQAQDGTVRAQNAPVTPQDGPGEAIGA